MHRLSGVVAGVRNEHGTGLLGTVAAVAAFLLLLLFTVQLLVNLYATTTVSAAGLDAARTVASRAVDHGDPAAIVGARLRAEARFRRLLGRSSDHAQLTWIDDGENVRLRVVMRAPGILPSTVAGRVAFGTIDRTFVVRVEELR